MQKRVKYHPPHCEQKGHSHESPGAPDDETRNIVDTPGQTLSDTADETTANGWGLSFF